MAARGPALLVATLSVTVPLPVPDAPLVTAIQDGAELDAVHAHQLLVVTVTVAPPPAAANDWLPGLIA